MPTLTSKKSSDKFKQPRPLTTTKAERMKYYGQRKWWSLRKTKLINDPLCEWCLKDKRTEPAVQIHHNTSPFSVPEGDLRSNLFWDYDNLISLCEQCHSTFHGKHKRNDYKGDT